MTNVIHIDFAKPRRKPVDAISESLAEFRIAALRSERLADEAFTHARAELTASMKACADALAEAIAYLTRNEPQMIAHPEKVRAA